MSNKGAGVFSLIAGGCFIAIWWVYLFGVKPDCVSSIEAAKQAFIFAVSPSEAGSWFFIYTLVSVLICLACAAIFFSGRHTKLAFMVTLVHGVVGFFLYWWVPVLFVGMPLTFATKSEAGKNA